MNNEKFNGVTNLVLTSAETNISILCMNNESKKGLYRYETQLNVKIPLPLSIDDLNALIDNKNSIMTNFIVNKYDNTILRVLKLNLKASNLPYTLAEDKSEDEIIKCTLSLNNPT